ncbi:Hsp20/alpha crystallin family protein [Isosphaeraceae bacterium EP7]
MKFDFQPVRISVLRVPPGPIEPTTEPRRARSTAWGSGHGSDHQNPQVDIHEGPDGLILEADLPGVSDDSVTIQLEDNILNLEARVTFSVPEGAVALHEEFPSTSFKRSFILSDEVDRSRISAELKNGVLRLFLPKADRARTRRIEIKMS